MDFKTDALEALRSKYLGEVLEAKANIRAYLANPVGIGEHPDIVDAINSQIEKLASADEKLAALNKYFGE